MRIGRSSASRRMKKQEDCCVKAKASRQNLASERTFLGGIFKKMVTQARPDLASEIPEGHA